MPRKTTIKVNVEPSIIKWAIGSSGWTDDDLIKKLKISQNTYSGWLQGEQSPTLRQLEDLASAIKRPLAAFFLSIPPVEKPLPKDYRMIPDREGKFDKKTILAIRRARRLQKISKELSDNLSSSISYSLPKATIANNPKQLAERYRQKLNFNERIQKKLRSSYEVFNFLRDSLERSEERR